MAEIVITPQGRDGLEAGTFVDDDGQTFVALTFRDPTANDLIVTFTPDLFRDYVAHLNNVVRAVETGSH